MPCPGDLKEILFADAGKEFNDEVLPINKFEDSVGFEPAVSIWTFPLKYPLPLTSRLYEGLEVPIPKFPAFRNELLLEFVSSFKAVVLLAFLNCK